MFSLEDMLVKLGLSEAQIQKHEMNELFREEAASIKRVDKVEIAKLFPNVTLSESEELVYAPFRLCHSLPKVNLRGRAFTPQTLSNSFASARDALINIDHQMSFRGHRDTICGHVVCSRFDPDNLYTDLANTGLVATEQAGRKNYQPKQPIPIVALAAFYTRSQYVPSFLEEHLSGKRKWHTSMECAHNPAKACFLYRGDFIPVEDAESGMRECVQPLSVRNYKGYPLSFIVGGLDGKVDFHSSALTPTPADDDANIMAFITRSEYVEAANAAGKNGGSTFFFPLESRTYSAEEGAEEIGNISILGSTHPTEDGHAHDVLSDGTVVPLNGHAHSMASFNITRGTNPKFTGKTDFHTEYKPSTEGPSKSHTHMHLVNISLRGKAKEPTTLASAPPAQVPVCVTFDPSFPVVDFSVLDFSLGEVDMTTKPSFNDVMGRLGRFVGGLKGLEGQAATEAASIKTDLEQITREEFLKTAVKTEIASMVEKGELVSKEKHEQAVKDATKAEADKAAAAQKETEARTGRREKVLALGLNMEDRFNDKIDLTVGDYINTFDLDEKGEKAFSVALANLEYTVEQNKKLAEAAKPAEETVVPKEETISTTAANVGKKPVTPVTKKPKNLLLVGAGASEEEEETELATAGGKAAANGKPKPGVGRGIFSSAVK